MAANAMPSTGLTADLGDRIAHAWTWHDGARVSTLDLVGPGLTLLTDEYGGIWRHAVPNVATAIDAHTVDSAAAAALGIHGGGAVLVRPDAKPLATWTAAVADPANAMAAAVTGMAQRSTVREWIGSPPWPASALSIGG